jgi:L-serine dehydratase
MVLWQKQVKGHGTDIAIQLGLSGADPVTFEVDQIDAKMNDIKAMKKILLHGRHEIDFDPAEDIEFFFTESLPFHPNALTFLVNLANGDTIAETYYSIGGGFVVREGEAVASGTDSGITIPDQYSLMIFCIGAERQAWVSVKW